MDKAINNKSGQCGFVGLELVALVVIMLAFLAGIVLLMDDAVRPGKGAVGRVALSAEGELVLGIVERMMGDAVAVGNGEE